MEAGCENGERYRAANITSILSGMWRYARSRCPNHGLVGPQLRGPEWHFKNMFHRLREDGAGAVVKHTAVVTHQDFDEQVKHLDLLLVVLD